jgi:hypothetical protein
MTVNIKWNEKAIREYVENQGYIFIELVEGVGQLAKIKIWCGDTEHESYTTTFESFKGRKNRKGHRCKECKNKSQKKWNEETIKKHIEDEGYIFIGMIKENNNKSIIKVWCGNENHEPYKVRFDAFKGYKTKQGTRCAKCHMENNVITWTKEKIIDYIESKNYSFIEFVEYKGLTSKIKVWCKNETHVPYETLFSNFQFKDSRCPLCKESKGEKEVREMLNKYKIHYIPQYKFEDCKSKRCLSFDFYLPKYNCCIEYDGGQHFEIVEWFGGFDGFVNTIIRDTIKNEYCKKNNIKLIRIPYWDFDNIENILIKELELK